MNMNMNMNLNLNLNLSMNARAIPDRHVQSKEKTLASDVIRHARLAHKEFKVANKLEMKAQKEHARLEKAIRKGDIISAEKHNTLEKKYKTKSMNHMQKANREDNAMGNSAYELKTTKLSGNGGKARCIDGSPAVITGSTYALYRPKNRRAAR